jgi:hypothetical protein
VLDAGENLTDYYTARISMLGISTNQRDGTVLSVDEWSARQQVRSVIRNCQNVGQFLISAGALKIRKAV